MRTTMELFSMGRLRRRPAEPDLDSAGGAGGIAHGMAGPHRP